MEGGGHAVRAEPRDGQPHRERQADDPAAHRAYGIGAPMIDHLAKLAAESSDRGWLLAYSDTMPNWFERFVGEEAEAAEGSRTRHAAAAAYLALSPAKSMALVSRVIEEL